MTPESNLQFDTSATPHAPELYAEAGIAQALDGLAAVDDAARGRYAEQGYLAVENAFSPGEIEAAKRGIDDLVMERHPGFTGITFENKARELLPTLALEDRLDAIRKFASFVEYAPQLRALAFAPELLRVVAGLLGAAPKLIQDMALVKPPKIGREKPWHQDHAFFDFPLGTPLVGVWIALDEATLENGCMRVLPGAHRDGPIIHFARRDWQICDKEMAGSQPIAVPLRPGGLLFFDGLIPHGTPSNFSPLRRRALQFHYAPESAAMTAREERLAVFGSEGKNVTC
jgi:phytanoyl-CoA hydroxylase